MTRGNWPTVRPHPLRGKLLRLVHSQGRRPPSRRTGSQLRRRSRERLHRAAAKASTHGCRLASGSQASSLTIDKVTTAQQNYTRDTRQPVANAPGMIWPGCSPQGDVYTSDGTAGCFPAGGEGARPGEAEPAVHAAVHCIGHTSSTVESAGTPSWWERSWLHAKVKRISAQSAMVSAHGSDTPDGAT